MYSLTSSGVIYNVGVHLDFVQARCKRQQLLVFRTTPPSMEEECLADVIRLRGGGRSHFAAVVVPPEYFGDRKAS